MATTPVPPIQRVAAHLARRFHQICVGIMSEVVEPEGLTPLQWAGLGALDDEPGIDQRRLATRLGIDTVSAHHLVEDLEAKGLIDRRVSRTDRRARELELTPAGLKLRRRLRPAVMGAQSRMVAPLAADEAKTLIALLTRVVDGNESYARPGNGRRKPGSRVSVRTDKGAPR